jgi:hypothetical protein
MIISGLSVRAPFHVVLTTENHSAATWPKSLSRIQFGCAGCRDSRVLSGPLTTSSQMRGSATPFAGESLRKHQFARSRNRNQPRIAHGLEGHASADGQIQAL